MKWSITTQERNALVETHLGCIWWTINKNRRLIVAAGLDDDDVFQQLAVRMIRAVENYDPDKGKDLEQHIFAQLQYEVLNCKDAARVYGIKGAPYGARDLTVSLEAMAKLNFYDTDAVKAFVLEVLVDQAEVRRDLDFERRQSAAAWESVREQRARAEKAEAANAAAIAALSNVLEARKNGVDINWRDVERVTADVLTILKGGEAK